MPRLVLASANPDKAAEAGISIVGGHTVDDDEPTYGLAVTGTVHPDRYIDAHGARAGDSLFLTKPLGTGTISTALKAEAASQPHVEQAVRWMTTLNRSASLAMVRAGAHAATDITGFGLAGHATRMADGSDVTLVIEESDLPLLPGVLELNSEGMTPGGGKRNREFFGPGVKVSEEIAEEIADIVFDPQTSGGLLIALTESEAHSLLGELQRTGNTEAAIIGRVAPRGRFSIELV